MGDVSCRAFTYFLVADQLGYVRVEDLLHDLPHDIAWYQGGGNRVPWDEWAVLCDRFRDALGNDDLLRSSAWRLAFESELTGPLKHVGRAFVSPRDLYAVIARWIIKSVYRVLEMEVTDVSASVLDITVSLPSDHRGSEGFFLMMDGALGHVTEALGLPPAQITCLEMSDHGGIWRLRLPEAKTLLARLRRTIAHLWSSPMVIELASQQGQLEADIAELFRARAELAQARAQVVHSRATVDALIRGLPDTVIRIDERDILVDVTAGAGSRDRTAGLRAQVGRPVQEVLGSLGDAEAEINRAIATARRGEVTSVQFRAIAEEAWFELRCIGVDGDVLVVARDVTESRVLQARLALSDRLATLGTLAASVAHEVNNPLTFVRTNIDLAVEGLSADLDHAAAADLRALLQEASDGTRHVGGIVRELLAFSRTEAGEPRAFDLAEVVRSALHLCSHELRHRGRVTVSSEDAPLAHGDPDRMVQVIVNLLVNAAQAGRAAAADTEIGVTIGKAPSGEPFVRIADSGVGISADALRRIFDPFFTTKGKEGSGLGLAISRGIVEDQGGRILVESEVGRGTIMTVILRAASVQPDLAPELAVAESVRGRILVLDDQLPVLRAMHRALSDHDVVALSQPEQAVERLLNEDFDLVLCDLMMPSMPGWEVHRQVAESRPDVARRFAFLSGGSPSSEGRDYLKAHDLPLLLKPFAPDDLRRFAQQQLLRRGDAA